jgi:hypothetical protein
MRSSALATLLWLMMTAVNTGAATITPTPQDRQTFESGVRQQEAVNIFSVAPFLYELAIRLGDAKLGQQCLSASAVLAARGDWHDLNSAASALTLEIFQ